MLLATNHFLESPVRWISHCGRWLELARTRGWGAIGVAPSPSLRSYTYVYPMGTVFSEVEEFIKVKRPSLIP